MMNLQFDPRFASRKTSAHAVSAPSQASTGPQASGGECRTSREDRVEFSQEALDYLQDQQQAAQEVGQACSQPSPEPLTPEERRQQAQREKRKAVQQMLDVARQQSIQMREQTQKQTDALKEQMDKMKKCAKIARSISKGHKVPPKDEKYLLENDMKAYMMAMALRMLAEQDNKKVKSVLDKEDGRQEEASSETSSPEAVSPDAPVAVEGGGE